MLIALLSLLGISISLAERLPTIRTHYGDTLRMKCDALPYRSVFTEAKCFFVLGEKVTPAAAREMCTSAMPGSTFTTNPPPFVWDSLFVEKSKFHTVSASTERKMALCTHEVKQECEQGTLISSGKCVIKSEKLLSYNNALKFCSTKSASLPHIKNDADNRAVSEILLKQPAWLGVSFGNKWSPPMQFGRFGTCQASSLLKTAAEVCPSTNFAIAVNPKSDDSAQGYWSVSEQKNLMDVICLRDASSDFYKAKPEKPKHVYPTKECITMHTFDPLTGECEWTGPRKSCLRLTNNRGDLIFINITDYPKRTASETDLFRNPATGAFNDQTVKAVVRRGCMATFYSHAFGLNKNSEAALLSDVRYGVYDVPSASAGTLQVADDGVSRVQCMCDPTMDPEEADNVKKEPCYPSHAFNKTTNQCEWMYPLNYCGEMISADGRKLIMNTMGKELYRRYNFLLTDPAFNPWRMVDYNRQIITVNVRQHCWMTLYSGNSIESKRTLETAGYGYQKVASFYNGMVNTLEEGTTRLDCQCITP